MRFDKLGAATPFARKPGFAHAWRERDDEAGALIDAFFDLLTHHRTERDAGFVDPHRQAALDEVAVQPMHERGVGVGVGEEEGGHGLNIGE